METEEPHPDSLRHKKDATGIPLWSAYWIEPARNDPTIADIIPRLFRRFAWALAIGLLLSTIVVAYLRFSNEPLYSAQLQGLFVEPRAQGTSNSDLLRLTGLANATAFLGNAGSRDADVTLARLTSQSFLIEFIASEALSEELLREEEYAEEPIEVQNLAAYDTFLERLEIDRNARNSLVTFRLSWEDPERSAQLLKVLIDTLNDRLQQETIANANERIRFLNERLQETNEIAIKGSIYSLIEGQLKEIMLSSVDPEIGIEVIDPPIPPLYPDQRSLFVDGVIWLILSFFFSGAIIAARLSIALIIRSLRK